jgi:hypothetical protein
VVAQVAEVKVAVAAVTLKNAIVAIAVTVAVPAVEVTETGVLAVVVADTEIGVVA